MSNDTSPIDMVLFCPNCGLQHIDRVEKEWDNPPHRSHSCAKCRHIWRPADVCTNGVYCTKTRGLDDSDPINGYVKSPTIPHHLILTAFIGWGLAVAIVFFSMGVILAG